MCSSRLQRVAKGATILHADLDTGFLITEDFGTAGFVEGMPPAPIADRYQAAADICRSVGLRVGKDLKGDRQKCVSRQHGSRLIERHMRGRAAAA